MIVANGARVATPPDLIYGSKFQAWGACVDHGQSHVLRQYALPVRMKAARPRKPPLSAQGRRTDVAAHAGLALRGTSVDGARVRHPFHVTRPLFPFIITIVVFKIWHYTSVRGDVCYGSDIEQYIKSPAEKTRREGLRPITTHDQPGFVPAPYGDALRDGCVDIFVREKTII